LIEDSQVPVKKYHQTFRKMVNAVFTLKS